MKFSVTYTQEDLLNNYLFVASKSDRMKRNRRKSWLLLVLFFVVAAITSYVGEDMYMMWGSIIAGLVLLLLYPSFQKLTYRRHYNKFANDRYNSLKDILYDFTITDDQIISESKIGNVIINTSQVESITETGNYFFIALSSKDVITLPKHSVDVHALSAQLTEMAQKHGLAICQELNWRWK
ncbi:YcxB family protein [Mucilaginibacter sp. Bleaf8]|nr:YcxB family protein [Mucilaginibacter sp. Bleaf8]